MTTVGKNIQILRKASGLTQEALASQLHVTRQAVSSWETGFSLPVKLLQMIQVPKLETYITRNATEKHQNDVFHNQIHRREMNHMSLRYSFFAVVPDGII